MDRSGLIRNPGKVHAALVKQPDDSVITTRDMKIYIPSRFVEKQLAQVGADIYTVGIMAYVVDDKYYAVSTINAMVRLSPTSIATVKFDGDSYLEFAFPAGSVVIADTKLLRVGTLVYKIFDEIIAKGRVPWYLSYEDVAKLFDTAETFADLKFGHVHSVLEMFAAAIARDPRNRSVYYRQTFKKTDGIPDVLPAYIPFRSITYGATNTTAKLLGSYFNEGLNSALVNPSEQHENIEDLLRR